MKNFLLIALLAWTSSVSATSYYISPNGNDSNNGTITSPFFTLNKAWTVVRAGDIIYVRGGVYKFNSRQTLSGKNGTATDTIKIFAYPGEKPVFTKSSSFTTPSWPVSLVYLQGNYTYWKGIEIAYVKQTTSALWYGFAVRGSNNNKFEKINSHHNGHGFCIRDESNHNLVLNCDFHHNYDPLTEGDAYGNADGLEVAYLSESMENTVKGCRFWNNSDDGLDLWNNNGNLIVDGCWSWNNGYREDGRTAGGDGGGLKFGSTTTTTGSDFKRTVKNCASFYNRTKGFNQNGANAKFYFYNNIAYKNPQGLVFYTYNLPHVFRNNIVFNNNENWTGDYSNAVRDHNNYDSRWSTSGPQVSTSDFISVDTSGVSRSRKSDGSMPDINFLKLAASSKLIDAGVNVGLPFTGKAPDLGAFEIIASILPSQPAAVLTYVSSEVKNIAPAQLEATYNLPIASVIPPVSCFAVRVNSVNRKITQITASDKVLRITLENPVEFGDAVTFSYTKPTDNPLQCTGGSIAESISSKTVLNSIASGPVFVNSSVENADPDKITLTYDVRLASVIPPASAFVARVNGEKEVISSVTVVENKVILTLPVDLGKSDTVTIAYVQPVNNALQSATGARAESLGDQAVANNVLGVTTGTDETLINGGKLLIFPNPAREYIKVANLEATTEVPVLRIYDFAGKLCQEIKLENMTRMRKIPLNLKSGIYISQLMIGSIVRYAQKLIVVKK